MRLEAGEELASHHNGRLSREVRDHCQGATAYEGEHTRNPSQRQREQAFAHEVQEEREN